MPGHGASAIRAGRRRDWGYRDLVDHYEAAVRSPADLRPNSPIFLLGHSLGGHVAVMLAGRDVAKVRGVALVASGVPYWRAWQGSAAIYLLVASQFFGVIARLLGYFPGHVLGFGRREARTPILQWADTARTGLFDARSFSGEALLDQPGPPIHAIGLRGDFFAPEASIRHMLDKLKHRDVEFEIWDSPPHGGNHNRWPSEPDFVVRRMVSFIEKTLGHE